MWQRDAPVADETLTSALEMDCQAIELSALRHGGTRQQLLDELAPLLAIGEPELTFIEGAWPTVYREVDRGPTTSSCGSSTPSSSPARSPTRRST